MNQTLPTRPWIVLAMVAGATASALVVADPAAAHTGLPASGALDGAVHPLVGLDHMLAMVIVGALAVTASDRRIAWLIPAGFLTGMVAGGVLGFVVEVPGTEMAVAVSVVAIGVVMMTTTRNRGLWLPVLVIAFGAVHGHAHGAELPAGATPLAYVVGFVAATAALHLSGTALGFGLRRLPPLRVAAGAAAGAIGVALLAAA